jgi:hypothetical protein
MGKLRHRQYFQRHRASQRCGRTGKVAMCLSYSLHKATMPSTPPNHLVTEETESQRWYLKYPGKDSQRSAEIGRDWGECLLLVCNLLVLSSKFHEFDYLLILVLDFVFLLILVLTQFGSTDLEFKFFRIYYCLCFLFCLILQPHTAQLLSQVLCREHTWEVLTVVPLGGVQSPVALPN